MDAPPPAAADVDIGADCFALVGRTTCLFSTACVAAADTGSDCFALVGGTICLFSTACAAADIDAIRADTADRTS